VRNEHENFDRLLQSLHVVDLGIIIGSGLEECLLLTEFAEQLHQYLGKKPLKFHGEFLD
jgi:hypothetical protein